MNISKMITEWRKGCSNTMRGSPIECKECTQALIDAIEKRASNPVIQCVEDYALSEGIPINNSNPLLGGGGGGVEPQGYSFIETNTPQIFKNVELIKTSIKVRLEDGEFYETYVIKKQTVTK